MYSFSVFIRNLKDACKNISMSDEDFVNKLISLYCKTFEIYTDKGDSESGVIYFDKNYTSDLLNNKRDLLGRIREPICEKNFDEKIENVIRNFTDMAIERDLLAQVISALRLKIRSAENVEEIVKVSVLNISDDLLFLSKAFVLALKIDNVDTGVIKNMLWSYGGSTINVIKDDLIKIAFDKKSCQGSIVVIPVNTTFETHISQPGELIPAVSAKTLHGKWLSRILSSKQTDENLLYNKIQDALRKYGNKPSSTKNKNKLEYPLGTIADIENGGMFFYLVAISEFDEYGLGHSSCEELKHSVVKLMKHYDRYGQGANLYVPLMGTGKSRINLSNQDSLELITKEMVAHANEWYGDVSIVALPQVYAELKFDFI